VLFAELGVPSRARLTPQFLAFHESIADVSALLTAMHFDRVTELKALHIDPKAKDTVLNLLAVTFTPSDAPAGELVLTFSGGAALKLHAECIEAQLKDLGGMWETAHQPSHEG
jgi:hypothetical protein